MSTSLKQVIEGAFAIAKSDAIKAAAPALADFFTTLAANPSKLGLVAAAAKLQGALIAALPTIEKDVLLDLASSVSAMAQDALGSSQTASSTTSSPTVGSTAAPQTVSATLVEPRSTVAAGFPGGQ